MSDCSQEVDVFVAVSVGVALLEIDPREIREVAYGGGFAGAPQDRALHTPGVDVADRLEPRAENVLDAELGCDRLYLERQRERDNRDDDEHELHDDLPQLESDRDFDQNIHGGAQPAQARVSHPVFPEKEHAA